MTISVEKKDSSKDVLIFLGAFVMLGYLAFSMINKIK